LQQQKQIQMLEPFIDFNEKRQDLFNQVFSSIENSLSIYGEKTNCYTIKGVNGLEVYHEGGDKKVHFIGYIYEQKRTFLILTKNGITSMVFLEDLSLDDLIAIYEFIFYKIEESGIIH